MPSPFRIHAVLALLCLVAAALPTAAQAWRQELVGSRHGGDDTAHAEALDASGNVLAVGALDNGDDGFAFVVTKLAAASGAQLWRQEINGSTESTGVGQGALAVAVDAAGDVVAAGEFNLDFTVVKFSGATGAELWREQIDGSDTFETLEEARAVAFDAAGDVFATGFVGNAGTGRDILVVKLAGASGNEMWRAEFDGGDGLADRASSIAVDSAGNVFASGRLATVAAKDDFTVIKLAGGSGAEMWRSRIDGSDSGDDEVLALALTASGDAVAVGVIDTVANQEDFAVVKLSGSSGSELWRKELDGGLGAPLGGSITYETGNGVTVDAAGDVIAIGTLEYVTRARDFVVIKLAGASGNEIWRQEIEGDMVAATDIGYVVATDPSGDVIAGGRIENGPRPSFDFSVLKFDGTTGAEIWRQMVDGSNTLGPRLEEVHGVLVDSAGDVIASGFLDNATGHKDFTVMKFDGATGVVGTVRGTKMRMRDYDGKPDMRLFSAEMRDATIWSPPPGSPDDPTIAGAEVRVVNPVTHEVAVFVLPPGPNWRASGNPPGAAGYIYSDDGTNGPCTLVQVRPRNSIGMNCSGRRGPISFSLDEASQGALGVTIRFGASPLQCTVFGGKVRKDIGTSNPGPNGLFQAVQARSLLGSDCP